MNLCDVLATDKNHLVQKVHLFDESKISFPVIVQEKYDGVFCIAYKQADNKIGIYSRTGKEYTSLDHLKSYFNYMFSRYVSCDFILFEAYIPNSRLDVISGLVRREKASKEVCAICHDMLTRKEYYGTVDTPYWLRYERLEDCLNKYLNNYVFLPSSFNCCGMDELTRIVNDIWSVGGEGIVIKDIDAPYRRGKRNYSLMKMKRGVSYDLEVIGIREGDGKYKNKVGAIICRFKNNTTISIGTGLIDSERELWFKQPNKIIHKIVQIDAMSESKNNVLREPVFKGIRDDKGGADY